MRAYDNGSFYTVTVSARELQDFAARWPCSGMRNASRGMVFEYDKRNGDLVDIKGERKPYDESAMLALSHDAQAFGRYLAECANCGGPLPTGHGCTSKDGKRHFCDACGNIAEALNIGARLPAFLYDDGRGHATCWTGGILGTIVHKHYPQSQRRYLDPHDPRAVAFGAVRYRVRMLDGSLWHGSGPTANGTYIRLRPMKGE